MEPKDMPLPKISLTDKQLPDVKDWEVGKTYKIVLTIKQVAKRQGSEWDMPMREDGSKPKQDKTITGTFQVMDVETDDEEDKDDGDDYETEYANRMGGK